MPAIAFIRVDDWAELGARWRGLEAQADGGFYRSWTFLGCEVATRFDDPYLLAVTQDGGDLALGLLNRRRGRFYLGQTGWQERDAVFVEHNGLLTRAGAACVVAPALRLAARTGAVVLAGVDDATLEAARAAGQVHVEQTRWAPAVDFSRLDGPYLQSLSANARAQIGRATRLYGAELALHAAPDVATGLRYFDRLIALHQASWTGRGLAGAFAAPAIRRFHRALIERGLPRGEVDLLRIHARDEDVGLLYNFVRRGRVLGYQSGFSPGPDGRYKPGLVSHALAVGHYRRAGQRAYDLLAGADRYKLTLAPHGGQNLHWATLYPSGSVRGVARRLAVELRAGVKSLLSRIAPV